jgi:hypothetical protein
MTRDTRNEDLLFHGTGILAAAFVSEGELLAVPGGIVATSEDLREGRIQRNPIREWNKGQIDDDLYLIHPLDEDMSYFFNHSCDPTRRGEILKHEKQSPSMMGWKQQVIIYSSFVIVVRRCAEAK